MLSIPEIFGVEAQGPRIHSPKMVQSSLNVTRKPPDVALVPLGAVTTGKAVSSPYPAVALEQRDCARRIPKQADAGIVDAERKTKAQAVETAKFPNKKFPNKAKTAKKKVGRIAHHYPGVARAFPQI